MTTSALLSPPSSHANKSIYNLPHFGYPRKISPSQPGRTPYDLPRETAARSRENAKHSDPSEAIKPHQKPSAVLRKTMYLE